MAGRTLIVHLRPSRYLLAFQILLHLLALSAPWLAALPNVAAASIDLVVLASGLNVLRRFAREGRRELHFGPEGWKLWQGDWMDLQERGQFVVTPWLLVLPFATSGGKRVSLILPPDTASGDEIRRLRLALRYGLQGRSAGGDMLSRR